MGDDAAETPPLHTNFADLSKAESSDLACSLASILLFDAGKDFSADNINAVLKASKASAGANFVTAYAGMLAKDGVGNKFDDIFPAAGGGGGGGGGGDGGDAGGAAVEEKKKSSSEESMGGGMDMMGGDDY